MKPRAVEAAGDLYSVARVAYDEPVDAPPNPQIAEEIPVPPVVTRDPLSLVQLEQTALEANPAVAAARADVAALRGKWVQSGLAPNPTAGYTSEDIGDNGTAGKQGAYVGQRFVTGGKLGLNRAVVAAEIARAEQKLAATTMRVSTDVRAGYYDVLIAQRKVDLTQELARVSEQAVKASQALIEAKEISVVGLLQTEVEAENARILVRRAVNERDAAWRRLSSVLGHSNLAPQPLKGELDAVESNLNWDEQLQRLIGQSPEVAAAVAETERSQRALDRAWAQITPDVSVQLGVQYDTASDDTVTGVQIGLPLPLWNRNQGGIQQAQSEIIAARRHVERVELNLRRRLATVFQNYADASYQVTKYSGDILPKAQRSFDLVSRGYKAGESGYLDMLTAQRTWFQTNLAYVEALRALWTARIQIDGLLLEDSLAVAAS